MQFSVGQQLEQGHYQIRSVLAAGLESVVYLADDLALQRPVVIKHCVGGGLSQAELKDAAKRFVESAQLLATLSHHNIARILDSFYVGPFPCIAIEFVDGNTLEEYVAGSPGGMPEAVIAEWGGQVCDALHYLHTRNPAIIFRDIKPSNIMVTRDGVVQLIDFGIARTFKPAQRSDTQRLGTPGYSPPEQVAHGQTGPYSDTYALGATLLRLATGLDPATIVSIGTQLPEARTLNQSVSPALSAVILKATQLQVNARYLTALELGQALRSIGSSAIPSQVHVPKPKPTVAIAQPTRRGSGHRSIVAVTSIVLMCCGVSAVAAAVTLGRLSIAAGPTTTPPTVARGLPTATPLSTAQREVPTQSVPAPAAIPRQTPTNGLGRGAESGGNSTTPAVSSTPAATITRVVPTPTRTPPPTFTPAPPPTPTVVPASTSVPRSQPTNTAQPPPPSVGAAADLGNSLYAIDSTAGWQSIGLYVNQGDRLLVRYVSGSWRNAPGSPFTTGEGYPNAGDGRNPTLDPPGSLLCSIGGIPISPRNYLNRVIPASGPLNCRMNDHAPADNSGSLIVEIRINP